MPEEFEKIIVKTGQDGRVVYLGDVARVELGAQDYLVNSYLDGKPAVAMAIQQLPGSNALATAERVRERMRGLSKDFPKGIEYRVVYDPTVFIDESVPLSSIRSSRPRCSSLWSLWPFCNRGGPRSFPFWRFRSHSSGRLP